MTFFSRGYEISIGVSLCFNRGQQIPVVTVECEQVIPKASSSNPNEVISTRSFGKVSVDRVITGLQNLLFDGTAVGMAQTRAYIKLQSGAEVKDARADSDITAVGCPSLGKLDSKMAVRLYRSSTVFVKADRKVIAVDCDNVGSLNAGIEVKVIKCSFGSASAGGIVKAMGCRQFGALSSGLRIEMIDSEVSEVATAGSVEIKNSRIHGTLHFTKDSIISASTLNSIIVAAADNFKIIDAVSKSAVIEKFTTVCLENTTVEGDIRFSWDGKIKLKGACEIKGKVIDADGTQYKVIDGSLVRIV